MVNLCKSRILHTMITLMYKKLSSMLYKSDEQIRIQQCYGI